MPILFCHALLCLPLSFESIYHPSKRMTDDDYDTEPYEGQTSDTSPEEMRYCEQDEAWDNYAHTSAPIKRPPYTYRVRRARQQIGPLPTTLPATPTTLHATPNVVKLIDTGFTIVITAIVTVCVVAFLLKSQCHCTCSLTI